ncbi:MAG: LD-carboxypeptidase [Bacteroidales bacterium]|nr:LD-carboxypeptidase [Bacteroidales bacterium]
MITPPYIKKGDTIGLIAPAKKITPTEVGTAVKMFESWDLHVKIGEHIYKECNQFAGNDADRAKDLRNMLEDMDVKAIIAARGGYGTIRLLEKVNFYALLKMPKWIVGYSDITALHIALNHQMNIETIHGIMPVNFPQNGEENESLRSLKKVLFGENPIYTFPSHPLNIKGKTEGMLIGGNLSVLYSLAGTKFDMNTEGKILFLEDLDEYLYHIDRMMMNLKLAGKLDKLRGLLVGGMTEMHDNQVPFGKTAEEIVKDIIKDYNIPVAFGTPAGHIDPNLALIMGRHITLEVNDTQSTITFN